MHDHKILEEVFDPRRVTLVCQKHQYFGPVKGRPELMPTLGCVDCWKIFYISELTSTPPDKREEKLAEIEEVMRDVVQLVEQGKFDFEPYAHAQVKIGKE